MCELRANRADSLPYPQFQNKTTHMNMLEKYTEGLIERDGIFFAKKESIISYPKEGNEHCFQIEEDSFWFNHRNNCIIETVTKYSPNEVFFDIGGGNGFVAMGLEKNGITTALIEPGIEGCLNAKKRGVSNIVCSTLEDASFMNNSIHAIGLFDVVEHIENDTVFLKLINNYLVENGLVYITVPAFNALWSDEDDHAGHFKRYTTKKLENILKESGFKIEFSTYIFSILPIPVFFFRSLPSRLGLNKNANKIDKHINEHKSKKGIADKVLNSIWRWELNRIKKGKKIPFGGSCLVVARKICG